ncbi:MAG: molybdopterin adenylyltransferase [Methylacidiphilales bacterium]|nr:molybdopterin adenylyltransferase [Candidatus Methylacidiphilales bacterium]
MKTGRITCSDRASAGVYEDAGGPEVERVFREAWPGPVEFIAKIVPDDVAAIEAALLRLADVDRCPLIITTGGTGFAARDVTPEATRAVLRTELPGFGEIMRSASFAVAPTSILSRATAGVRGVSLIINLPGNPKAIAQCLPPLVPAIREALRHLHES